MRAGVLGTGMLDRIAWWCEICSAADMQTGTWFLSVKSNPGRNRKSFIIMWSYACVAFVRVILVIVDNAHGDRRCRDPKNVEMFKRIKEGVKNQQRVADGM